MFCLKNEDFGFIELEILSVIRIKQQGGDSFFKYIYKLWRACVFHRLKVICIEKIGK